MSEKCQCGFLEEIHGFNNPSEFERFKIYLKNQVDQENIQEIQSDENYHKGLIYGGKWFKCLGCGEKWRLVEPDFPFKGLWERIDETVSG